MTSSSSDVMGQRGKDGGPFGCGRGPVQFPDGGVVKALEVVVVYAGWELVEVFDLVAGSFQHGGGVLAAGCASLAVQPCLTASRGCEVRQRMGAPRVRSSVTSQRTVMAPARARPMARGQALSAKRALMALQVRVEEPRSQSPGAEAPENASPAPAKRNAHLHRSARRFTPVFCRPRIARPTVRIFSVDSPG